MDSILKRHRLDLKRKQNLAISCLQRTPKGEGQKKVESRQWKKQANTNQNICCVEILSDPVYFMAKYQHLKRALYNKITDFLLVGSYNNSKFV